MKQRFPKRAVLDQTLPLCAKRLLVALYAFYGATGSTFPGHLKSLCTLTGLSLSAVRLGLSVLTRAGYLIREGRDFRLVPAENVIELDQEYLEQLLAVDLSGASVAVFLYLFYCQGAGKRTPSLRGIARGTGLGRASVCRAIHSLSQSGILRAEHHTDQSGAKVNNTYVFRGWKQ